MKRIDKDSQESSGLIGANNHGAKTFWFPFLKKNAPDPRPNSEIPISQYFSEGNGGESRYSLFTNYIFSFTLLLNIFVEELK